LHKQLNNPNLEAARPELGRRAFSSKWCFDKPSTNGFFQVDGWMPAFASAKANDADQA